MAYPKLKFPGFGEVFSPEEKENRMMGMEDKFLKNSKCRAVAMAKFMGRQIRSWHKKHFENKGYEVKEDDLLFYIKEGKLCKRIISLLIYLSNQCFYYFTCRIYPQKNTQEKAVEFSN